MKHSHSTAASTAAVFLVLITTIFAGAAAAQVEVVESNPIIRPIGQTPGVSPFDPNASPSNPLDDLFQQIQTLQLQVQQQTGLIEELNYEIQRLKQQRLDDYVDLDRRLSELTQNGASNDRPSAITNTTPANPNTGSSIAANTNGNSPAANAQDETTVYRAANDLISAREWDKAIAALQGYLTDFPGGRFESNAHYWLGELYFVKNDLDNARDSFQVVIDQFPTSNKLHASKYKLGRTYFQLGDQLKAQQLLQEVAATNSDSSRQAALFLRENF